MSDKICEDRDCDNTAVWSVQWGNSKQYVCEEHYHEIDGGISLSSCPGIHRKLADRP